MAKSGSRVAVVVALAANLGVALTKFVAFAFTGSSAMLAEGVHSVADTGNQVLLLIGGKRAQQPASRRHPFGHGRSRFLYGFLVAVMIFGIGGLFALYEAYEKILDPKPITEPVWAFAVLIAAMVLEGTSLRTAIRKSDDARGRWNWVEFVRETRAPELIVVLLEDLGALTGLAFALIGVTLTVVTGNGVFDGLGSLAIGLLLVSVALLLAHETNSLLLGEAATDEDIAAIEKAIRSQQGVQQVLAQRTMHLSPDQLLVVARVEIRDELNASQIARLLDGAEQRIREAVDKDCLVYLEPDLHTDPPKQEQPLTEDNRAAARQSGGSD